MTVDLYKPCPCGSGKKIKFCCRDIANDLERIQRMIEGEQRLAAIEKIDSVLKKHPKHSALLMLKAEALEIQGRKKEAAAVRLDSLGWARYGFGSERDVRGRLSEIASLTPRGSRS